MRMNPLIVALTTSLLVAFASNLVADDVAITLNLTYSSGAGSAGTWELLGRIDSTSGTADGQFGFSAVRSLLNDIDFGIEGDAVTLASGIGAIDPIAENTPFERNAVITLPDGTIDVLYGQNLAETNGQTVVFNVGNSGDNLLASGTFTAGMTPSFGMDTTGPVTLFTTALFLPEGSTPFSTNAYDADNTFTTVTDNLPNGVTGDYDGNGIVDAADYTVWLSLLGSSNATADGDGSGTVDVGDYTMWKSNFGNSAGATGGSQIPEPTAMVLLLASGGLIAIRRQR